MAFPGRRASGGRGYLARHNVALVPFSSALSPARAAWPEGPIRMVVPFAPAGGQRPLARVIGIRRPALGQTIISRTWLGANGTLGTTMSPSGETTVHVLVTSSVVSLVNHSLSKSADYDPNKGLCPDRVGGSPNVIVTRPDSGIAEIQTADAREAPPPDI